MAGAWPRFQDDYGISSLRRRRLRRVKLNRYVVIARGNLKVWFADRKDGLAIGIESDPINSLWILRLKMGQLQRVCATAAKLKSAVIAGRDLRGVSPVGQITNGANAVEPRIVKRSGALA